MSMSLFSPSSHQYPPQSGLTTTSLNSTAVECTEFSGASLVSVARSPCQTFPSDHVSANPLSGSHDPSSLAPPTTIRASP